MRDVLITGAAGFLGRWFTAHHLEAGDHVTAIDDLSNPHAEWPKGVRGTLADAGTYFTQSRNDFDLTYHFAMPVRGRVQIERDPLFNADGLRLDEKFFRWAMRHTDLAVYPSSSAVYGTRYQQRQGWRTFLREDMVPLDDPRQPDIPVPDEIYGWVKLVGEVLASRAGSFGLNTLCIRPFSGYGEDQSVDYPISAIAARVAKRQNPLEIWGSGGQIRDWVHASDIVAATQARLEAGVKGHQVLNIGTGVGTSMTGVAYLLADLAGYQPDVVALRHMPEGVSHRVADITLLRKYYEPKVDLRSGLALVLATSERREAAHA